MNYGGTTAGSFIPALCSLGRALVSRGDRFAVVATDVPDSTWPAQLEAAGADVRLVRDERSVLRELDRLAPDVVHSHFVKFDLTVLRHRGSRIFWHVHSYATGRTLSQRARAFAKYRLLSRGIRALVPVSAVTGEYCLHLGAPRDRVRVVPNGIDTNRFRPPTETERAHARAQFGIAPQDRVVLFFERAAYKGGDVLREALAMLPECRVLVVGGSDEDRARFRSLPRAIDVPRVADAVQAHWAADALAFPSRYEAFGLVLAEAIACGLPVAAASIPAVDEIAGAIPGVMRFPPGDAGALAIALERALSCRDTASGVERMRSLFGLDRWTREILALYDEPAPG